jgi:hypothetical protein
MLRKLRLDPKTLGAVVPLVGRYGAKGAVVVARSYLGPVADEVARRAGKTEPSREAAPTTPAAGAETPPGGQGTPKRAGLDAGEVAILAMALTKLLYEAGELADGKQPEFKLDEQGRAPALSLTHVVAATRLVRSYAAERAERKQAERAQELALEQAKARASPRALLQAARGQQYALVTRHAYAPTSFTTRTRR